MIGLGADIDAGMPVAIIVGAGEPRGATAPGVHQVDGAPAHVSNRTSYDGYYRRYVSVCRPDGWPWGEPRQALAWAMFCVAVSSNKPVGVGVEVHQSELDESSHDYQAATLTVDCVAYQGWMVHGHGVRAWAVTVAGGWTVLAVAPEGQEPVVELARAT